MSIEPLTRARRREMTRRHLIDAAAVVFARDGFHGASLEDVATMAGFTKGAVYSNFESKEDLFLAVFDDRLEQQAVDIQAALEQPVETDGPTEQLPRVQGVIERMWDDEWTALYLEFALYAKRNPQAREKLAASARREHAITVGMLTDAYARQDVESDFPIPVLATIAMSLFEGLALERFVDSDAITHDTVAEVLRFLYGAIEVAPNPAPGRAGPASE